MKDLVKYLAYSEELDKKKEELAKISAELENIDSVIEKIDSDIDIWEKTSVPSTIYKYWDALNKKEKTLQYAIAKLELEIAKFELDQAYAE